MPHAVIAGSGFGGLAAALRLRAKGYEVTVLEKQSQIGGKATVIESGPFQYDAGPTVVTAKVLFEELFQLFGRDPNDYVRFLDVSPWYAFDFPNGKHFHYGPTYEDTLKEIERLFPEDLEGYKQFFKYSKALFHVAYEEYGTVSFDRLLPFLKATPHFLKLRCFENCTKSVSRFFKSPELRQAFSVPPLLVGGNPNNTPALYLLIHYLENKWGIVFPKGGMGALVQALVRLAKEEGIDFVTETAAQKLKTAGDRVTHITTERGEALATDMFVFNGDPMTFYSAFVDAKRQHIKTKLKKNGADLSMGLFVLYFSTKKQYDDVPHHLILFSDPFDLHIEQIFKRPALPTSPNVYLHRPRTTDPDIAPEGTDSFYALVPVPNLKEFQDWSEAEAVMKERTLNFLEERALPGLKESLVDLHVRHPKYFQEKQYCYYGSAFTIQPKLSQSAYFRFTNQLPEFANAFFVGAGTHPGAGLPGVLTSAKILERCL